MPAFVPIMFETVFFAAFNGCTFYMRSKLWPFKQAENLMSEQQMIIF
jgi:hypothetical protein